MPLRPNWFLAFTVPADGWFPGRVPPPPAGVRVFHPLDLHMTVAFLGAVDEPSVLRAWDATDPSGATPVDVRLARVEPFGPRRRPSAFSAVPDPDHGRDELAALIAAWRPLAEAAAGATRDERPPRPHCTLARPRRRATDDERARALRWARKIDVRDVRLTISELALYTWADDRRERLFRIVRRTTLGSP